MSVYEKILKLSANDCIGCWRDICEMIAATQNHLLRLDQVYFLIKYLAGLSTWQAWVIANQVYRKYVSSGNDEQFNKDIGIKILSIVQPTIHSDNPTIVTNSVIIYAGIWYRSSMHIPMPRKERDIIECVYKRIPMKFIEEKEELGFFLRFSEAFIIKTQNLYSS